MVISKPEHSPNSADGSPSPPPRTDAPWARPCRKIAPNVTSGADKAIKITHGEIELDCPCSRRSAHVARIVWRLASGALPDPRRQTPDDVARSRAGARSPGSGRAPLVGAAANCAGTGRDKRGPPGYGEVALSESPPESESGRESTPCEPPRKPGAWVPDDFDTPKEGQQDDGMTRRPEIEPRQLKASEAAGFRAGLPGAKPPAPCFPRRTWKREAARGTIPSSRRPVVPSSWKTRRRGGSALAPLATG